MSILLTTCIPNKFSSKISYRYYLDASPHDIDLKLDLKSDRTFQLKNQTLFCDNHFYGNYLFANDTLLLAVTFPTNYGAPLDYDIEYIDNSRERFIEIISTESLCKMAFPTIFLNYNDGIRADFIKGSDCSAVFRIPELVNINKIVVPMESTNADNLEILLKNPTSRSMRITVKSMPFINCKIPKLTKWLSKNDTLYSIVDGKLNLETPFLRIHQ